MVRTPSSAAVLRKSVLKGMVRRLGLRNSPPPTIGPGERLDHMTFRRLCLIVACMPTACNRESKSLLPVSTTIEQVGAEVAGPAALNQPPFDELAFVPAETDLVVRVDLGAMVAAEPE